MPLVGRPYTANDWRVTSAWFSVMGLPAEPNIPVVVENVWTYSRESQTNILKGVCFKVAEGGCFGILGAPGAGKSTLLKILVGLSQPSQGTVTLSPGASSARSPRQVRQYTRHTDLREILGL